MAILKPTLKYTKGISIWEILVVLLLSVVTLFVVVRGITGVSVSILKQTEFLNCLSIAKSLMDLYSYYPRGSLNPINTNKTFNIGNVEYFVNITVEDFGNITPQLNLRRIIIIVSSPRVRNLRVRLTNLI